MRQGWRAARSEVGRFGSSGAASSRILTRLTFIATVVDAAIDVTSLGVRAAPVLAPPSRLDALEIAAEILRCDPSRWWNASWRERPQVWLGEGDRPPAPREDKHGLLHPDWDAVAAEFDWVHLTVERLISAQGVAVAARSGSGDALGAGTWNALRGFAGPVMAAGTAPRLEAT